jgi:PrtD family type I secretion system ABC transporter
MNPLLPLLRRPLLHVLGLSLAVNLLQLVPALFMLQVFDRVLSSQSTDTLLVLLLGAGVAFGLMAALDYLRSRLQGVGGTLLSEALSPVVARIAIAQGAQRGGRAANEGLRDVASLRQLFSAQGLLALFDAPWALVFIGVIWLAHPGLGIAATACAALMLGLAFATDRFTRHDIEALQRGGTGAMRTLEASLQNAEVAQVLGMTGALLAGWRRRQAELAPLQAATARRTVAMAVAGRTLRQAVQVMVLALGAWLVINGEASAGVMIATTTLLGRALAPVEQVVGSWKLLAESRSAFGRVAALLADDAAQPERLPLPAPRGALQAQQLFFRPAGSDRTLIAGLSLQLAPGEALGIIGASGAGKSTLVRLLTGVWKPSSGSVRLDGADLSQWPREQIGPHLGYVPQDVELFAGTVAENIARMGEPDAERVVRAAQQARVHELILSLPDGYETQVDSMALSPGQRQRIALARALYGEPALLILDEPNSNLDGAGELALAETLKSLRGRCTVVVVTHRTNLVQQVDQLLVMEAGRALHQGRTADVLKALQQPASPQSRVVAMPRAVGETA